jgi:hypothetical protein
MGDKHLDRVNDIVKGANDEGRELNSHEKGEIIDLLDDRKNDDGCLLWLVPAFSLSLLLLRFLARG